MADSPLSRRQFFGATAAVAAVGTLPAPAAEARPSPLAPEPPPPPGVCQRLGSARFRELEALTQDVTGDIRFSPDSKWLVHFGEQGFLGYEVATGRRVKWADAEAMEPGITSWQLANDAVLVLFADDDLATKPPHLYDLETGRRRKLPKLTQAVHHAITPDGTGLIQCNEKELRRVNLRTGKVVWKRKWATDASVPEVLFTVTERWIVAVGAKRLHLFNPASGEPGPRLEDAAPQDAQPGNYFLLIGFSADGKRIAGRHTGEVTTPTVVWDTTTGKAVGRPNLPDVPSSCVLTADGLHLLTTDQTLRLVGVDVRTGKVTRHLAAQDVSDFRLSPDGRVLACFRSPRFRGFGGIDGLNNQPGGIIRLLNPATGELLSQSPDPACELNAVRFADRHTVVADVDFDPMATRSLVWDVRTDHRRVTAPPLLGGLGGGFLGGFGGGFAVPMSHALSPDATRVVTMGFNELCVTDAFTRRRLHTFPLPLNAIDLPFWVGRGAVAMADPGGLHVWDLVTRTRRTLPLNFAEEGLVQARAVTPDGNTVALMHADANEENPVVTLAWVDVRTGGVTTRRGESGELSISADGNRLAVTATAAQGGEEDIRVAVIDRGGRRVLIRQESSFDETALRAEFSPCGRAVFLAHSKRDPQTGALTPVVQFWEALGGELRAEFATAHPAGGLGVSPCGRRVVTTHRDAPVYLWDVFGEKSDPQAKPDAAVWDALDGPADKAFAAIRRLVQHPTSAVELLAAKLAPAEAPKAEWVKARIDKLGSTDFRTRHTAELDLSAVADRITEPLRKAIAAGAESLEADERLNLMLEKAEGVPRSAWRAVRAVEALESCDVPSAAVLLKKLANGVESAVLTKEAKAAVGRIK